MYYEAVASQFFVLYFLELKYLVICQIQKFIDGMVILVVNSKIILLFLRSYTIDWVGMVACEYYFIYIVC